MRQALTSRLTIIFFLTFLFGSVYSQTIPQEFWENPNVIWKTNTGTVITASFAKKMHIQGHYTFEERSMTGARKEIRMIPPKRKSSGKIDWEDAKLMVVDEYDQRIPIAVAKSMIKVISSQWEIDTLESGKIILKLPLVASGKSMWTYTGSESISNWIADWRGKNLPAFSLKNQYDEIVNNRTTSGKILVLHFWNTNCRQCQSDIPQLNKIREVFSGEDVVFLAANYEGQGTIQTFLRKEQFDYQVLSSSQPLFDQLSLDYYPTHMIVDEEGKILYINVGGGPRIGEEIGKKLSWLLND